MLIQYPEGPCFGKVAPRGEETARLSVPHWVNIEGIAALPCIAACSGLTLGNNSVELSGFW